MPLAKTTFPALCGNCRVLSADGDIFKPLCNEQRSPEEKHALHFQRTGVWQTLHFFEATPVLHARFLSSAR
jgi:hypothetical protein